MEEILVWARQGSELVDIPVQLQVPWQVYTLEDDWDLEAAWVEVEAPVAHSEAASLQAAFQLRSQALDQAFPEALSLKLLEITPVLG